jgi:hypothetical protein
MRFNVLNWNIGGAKYLETKTKAERAKVRTELNEALNQLVKRHKPQPDVVTLQEIVRYREPSDEQIADLIDPIEGYDYCPVTLIDTELLSSQAKWNKVKADSDWNPNTFFAQGNAFLFKKTAPRFPVWDLSNLSKKSQVNSERSFIERVSLESGLYFGDRNTEPRAALIVHLIYDPLIETDKPVQTRRPLDIFVVNLHLTTLMMEREGIPEIDEQASRLREAQLTIVFNGIVSRYNSWKQQRYPQRGVLRTPEPWEAFQRHAPVWILAGDFNISPESDEYAHIRQKNFIDTVPQKGNGTKAKGVGNPATLTLDYVFAGPKFISLDPFIEERGLKDNAVDHNVFASDHYPMFASIPLDVLATA